MNRQRPIANIFVADRIGLMTEQDIKQQIGDLIRQARKARGLTQKELGERLGIGEDRVSRYENGRTNFTVGTLQEIFDALETKLKLSI